MKILIVTEDNSEISSLKGHLLKIISDLYIKLYRYKLMQEIERHKEDETLLITNSSYKPNNNTNSILFNEEWGELEWEKIRFSAWKIARSWHNNIKNYKLKMRTYDIFLNDISETRIAMHLSRSVISYKNLIEKKVKQFNPDKILVMTKNSPPENFALETAEKKNIQFNTICKINIYILYNYLRKLFWKIEEFKTLANLKNISQSKRESPKKESVFIIASHELHLKSIKPIIEQFEKKDISVRIITDIKDYKQSFAKYKISKKYYYNFLQEVSFKNIKNEYIKIKEEEINLQKTVPYLRNYIDRYLFVFFNEKIAQYAGLSAVYAESVSEFLLKHKPKAIIFISDRGAIEKSFSLIAKKLNIPTFLTSPNTLMSLDKTNEYNICDYILVVGKNIKEELIKIGVPEKKITIVGDSRFDDYFDHKFIKEKIINKYNLKTKDRYILLISTYISSTIPYSEKKLAFQLVSEAVKNLKNYKLLIKAHPNEDLNVLASQIKEWRIKGTIASGNIQDFLYISEAVCQTFSMSGLEAIVFNRPVFIINPKDTYEKHIPYIKNNAAIGIFSPKELVKYINLLDKNQSFKRNIIKQSKIFCKRYLGLLDGKSSKRIVKKVIPFLNIQK